jgi:cytochrome c
MSMNYIQFRLAAVVLLTLFAGYVATAQDVNADEATWSAYGRYVDETGNISLPQDFATTWAHLGTWALVEDDLVPDLHSVYAPRSVVEYFRKHREFPDGAMLVKELRHAKGSDHTTGRAFWATDDVIVWFAMVKDDKQRFSDNPIWGDGWGWALFDGEDRSTQIATDYEAECLSCHVPAEKMDWSYVYAYPVLGDSTKKYVPADVFE